jgi:ABC-type multidrug transport system ATPase subunit
MCFSYPGRELFTHWSTGIAPGVTLVRGGDGCGKSTLLRLLAGEQQADAGQFQLNDVRLDAQPAAYRQQVYWVDPRTDAFEQMTAADYLKSLPRLYPQFDEQALPGLIEGLSLGPHMQKFFYMLSTGSKRKVWLAGAFASGAPLALLDEPFAGLDKVSIDFVLARLTQAAEQGSRAWVLADYQAPREVPLAATIDLGD